MKQKILIIHPSTSLLFLLFYSPKPRSQVRILIYRKWCIWRFFDAIFPRKRTRYLAPRRLISDPRAFGFVISHERKDSGDENTSGVRHADLYLGRPGLPLEVVSARLNFSARGPKKVLLHGKNQAGRALY